MWWFVNNATVLFSIDAHRIGRINDALLQNCNINNPLSPNQLFVKALQIQRKMLSFEIKCLLLCSQMKTQDKIKHLLCASSKRLFLLDLDYLDGALFY